MKILRRFLVGTFSFGCALAISSLLWLLVMQATVMQPAVVKGWLRESGVYGKVVGLTPKQVASQTTDQTFVTPSIVDEALQKTFTPAYVESQSEKVIDTMYAWLEGKSPNLGFTIPVDEQRPAFTEQLAAALEPQVATLPPCTTVADAQALRCRPPDASNAEFAHGIAEQVVSQTDTLQQPLTEKSVAGPSQDGQSPNSLHILNQLPTFVQLAANLLTILPFVALVCAILIWPLATDRLVAYKRLARRICLGSLLSFTLAIFMLYASANLDLSLLSNNPITTILLPVAQKAASVIGQQLAIISGVASAASATAWIICIVFERKRQKPQAFRPLTQLPPLPKQR